jgi:serine/threonine protein kinase
MPVSFPFLKPTTALDRKTLGKYSLLSRLSTGGMSEIFLATQNGMAGFRKVVVLKTILPSITGEEEFVRMFLEEARITSSFNHPNIAQVFDLGTDQDTLFIAMEFVQGATLNEVTRACEGRAMGLPIGFALTTVRDTAVALHYAHTFVDPRGRKQPVIHRDVSGKNLMVTYDGITKLLDFGIAKSLGAYRSDTTSTGTVKGTAGYMSPEQVLGEPLDGRSDVFALGVVLHEALTGKRLFARPTEEQEMRAVLNETAEPPSRSNPAVTYPIDKVAMKALSLRRDNRYASALEFARALESASAGKMWHPEQLGALVTDLHAERLKQTRALIQEAQGNTGEHTRLVPAAPVRYAEAPTGETKGIPLVSVPERGITLETPIQIEVDVSTMQHHAHEPEEPTSPALLPGRPLEAAPALTASMRPPPTLAPADLPFDVPISAPVVIPEPAPIFTPSPAPAFSPGFAREVLPGPISDIQPMFEELKLAPKPKAPLDAPLREEPTEPRRAVREESSSRPKKKKKKGGALGTVLGLFVGLAAVAAPLALLEPRELVVEPEAAAVPEPAAAPTPVEPVAAPVEPPPAATPMPPEPHVEPAPVSAPVAAKKPVKPKPVKTKKKLKKR